MEKFYAEDKYFESRNSELEYEYETQDLYHKLKTLEVARMDLSRVY